MDASKISPSPASFPIDLSAGRKARIAVFPLFALDGIAFGSWAAYLPVYKARLGLSDGQLGVVLFALVVGSLVSMPATGRALARWSSRRVVLLGAAACSVTIPLVTIAAMTAGSLGAFVVAALLFGAAKGVVDVAANSNAIEVERFGGKPWLSTCHGGWSLGVLIGATAIAIALKVELNPLVATVLVAAGLLAVVAAASRMLADVERPAPGSDAEPAASVWPRGRLIPIAALAFLGLFCEGAMGDWATIFLVDVVKTSAPAAAMAFAAYSLVMMCGRFAGDRIVARLGPLALLAASGVGLAAGLSIAIAFRTYPAAVLGFSIVGLGVSNMVPILFRAAGRDGDSGAAIASVSTVGYLGFLIGPPLIGAASQSVGLASALLLVVLFGLTIAACSRLVADRPEPESPSSKNLEERIPHVRPEPSV